MMSSQLLVVVVIKQHKLCLLSWRKESQARAREATIRLLRGDSRKHCFTLLNFIHIHMTRAQHQLKSMAPRVQSLLDCSPVLQCECDEQKSTVLTEAMYFS